MALSKTLKKIKSLISRFTKQIPKGLQGLTVPRYYAEPNILLNAYVDLVPDEKAAIAEKVSPIVIGEDQLSHNQYNHPYHRLYFPNTGKTYDYYIDKTTNLPVYIDIEDLTKKYYGGATYNFLNPAINLDGWEATMADPENPDVIYQYTPASRAIIHPYSNDRATTWQQIAFANTAEYLPNSYASFITNYNNNPKFDFVTAKDPALYTNKLLYDIVNLKFAQLGLTEEKLHDMYTELGHGYVEYPK